MKVESRVFFKHGNEGLELGYRPCGRCSRHQPPPVCLSALRRGACVLGVARKPNASSQMLVQVSTENCHYLQADVTVESDHLGIIEKTKDLFAEYIGDSLAAGPRFDASKRGLSHYSERHIFSLRSELQLPMRAPHLVLSELKRGRQQ